MLANSQAARAVAFSFFFSAVLCSPAHAENRLFPTDVLKPSEVDAQLTVATSHQDFDKTYYDSISWLPVGNLTIRQSSNSLSQAAMVAYGLPANTEAGFSVDYFSYDKFSYQLQGYDVRSDISFSGVGQYAGWIKHQFIDGSTSPLTLYGEVDVFSHPSNDLQTLSSTSIGFELGASWDFGRGLKVYSLFDFTVPNRASLPKTEVLSFGVWVPVVEQVTLAMSASYGHAQSTSWLHSQGSQGFDVRAIIDLSHNTYLIPLIGVARTTATDDLTGYYHQGSSNIKTGAIKLYHLF